MKQRRTSLKDLADKLGVEKIYKEVVPMILKIRESSEKYNETNKKKPFQMHPDARLLDALHRFRQCLRYVWFDGIQSPDQS